MNDGTAEFLGGLGVGIVAAVLLAVAVSCTERESKNKEWRQAAVKHGAAKFIATPEGEVEFKWNDETKTP